MAKDKKTSSLDPFTEWAHNSGRIFLFIFIAYMVAIPFIICTVYNCMPTFAQCLPGLISIFVIMGPTSIAEIGSYTPILGSSCYLTFASGNLMNLKMPCIVNAQTIAKVEPSTVEGDAIALIATAVSSSVTIIILAVGMVCLGFISPLLENEAFATASDYLLPALFGAMSLGFLSGKSGKTRTKNYILPGLVPAVIIAILTVMGYANTGMAGILLVVMIPVTILCAWVLYKFGIVKIVPNE